MLGPVPDTTSYVRQGKARQVQSTSKVPLMVICMLEDILARVRKIASKQDDVIRHVYSIHLISNLRITSWSFMTLHRTESSLSYIFFASCLGKYSLYWHSLWHSLPQQRPEETSSLSFFSAYLIIPSFIDLTRWRKLGTSHQCRVRVCEIRQEAIFLSRRWDPTSLQNDSGWAWS